MLSRRETLGAGVSALAMGMLGRSALAKPPGCPNTGSFPWITSAPIRALWNLPDSIMVDGFPFAPWWTGDSWANDFMPFHHAENVFPGGSPPPPTESVDVAIIGGGLSGLTSAYLLREHNFVLFDLRATFGGACTGEAWGGVPYSLGSAYFITPDEGTFLDRLYRGLGVDRLYRLSSGEDPVGFQSQIVHNLFRRHSTPAIEREAYQRYSRMVDVYAEQYPDIPLDAAGDTAWIRQLDTMTFKQHVEQTIGMQAPPLLASMIQGYFYSSFGAGWEEISAASGWNFVAAEEFGRWVLPGGNAGLAQALFAKLALRETAPGACPGQRLRAGCRVADVRLAKGGAQVTYRDAHGAFRSLMARKVVMACSKHIAKYMIHDLETLAPGRFEDYSSIPYCCYMVMNVLLTRPIRQNFYDLFLLYDGQYPRDGNEAEQWSRVVDALNGAYAVPHGPNSVLTLYWPLPYALARVQELNDEAWLRNATSLAPRLREILALLNLRERDVRQIRMTRWGHAFPIAERGLIADGVLERVRQPIDDRIYFVNQDNWALPAVETCLLEAAEFAPKVARGL
jgi:hypothetical protein